MILTPYKIGEPPHCIEKKKVKMKKEIIKGLGQSVHIILLLYLKNCWVKAAINLSRDIFCLFEVIKV